MAESRILAKKKKKKKMSRIIQAHVVIHETQLLWVTEDELGGPFQSSYCTKIKQFGHLKNTMRMDESTSNRSKSNL